MRAGAETALARIVKVFGAVHPQPRCTRSKLATNAAAGLQPGSRAAVSQFRA